TDVTVQGSTFSDIGRVGVAIDLGANGNLMGNTYTGKGAGEFVDIFAQVTDGSTATIDGNTVTGNVGVGPSNDNSAAVLISQLGGASASAQLFGNSFTGNTVGIKVGDNA